MISQSRSLLFRQAPQCIGGLFVLHVQLQSLFVCAFRLFRLLLSFKEIAHPLWRTA